MPYILSQNDNTQTKINRLDKVEFNFKNYLFDYFYKHLTLRLNHNYGNFFVFDIILSLCVIMNMIKYLTLLRFKFSIKTRLILFDWSLITGGNEIFQHLAVTPALICQTYFHYLFYINSDEQIYRWIKVFEVIQGVRDPHDLGFNKSHINIIFKIQVKTKHVFIALKYFHITFGKL